MCDWRHPELSPARSGFKKAPRQWRGLFSYPHRTGFGNGRAGKWSHGPKQPWPDLSGAWMLRKAVVA